jgi:lysophospholipase
VDSFEEYLEDLGAFHTFLRERHGVTREVTLLGHSLGGLTAIHWALRHSASIRALILSSPMLGLRVPRWLIDLNGLMNQWAPGFIYRNPVYPRYLTHDAEEVRKYKQDPLIARKISVRLVSEMISYARRIEQNASPRFECPVYVLMAGDDRVVDTARTEAFFEKVCAPGKEMTAFPGCYHEIFNERGQERVFELLEGILAKVYGGR